ncbi:P-loop NTPase [Natronobacterium texcoconense]|uniref:ATP-binding protein involved in chromosome partitioning n=1 Tax=Natronobacterium texcoconense TaxID=1095778 RepID=A0A1H1CJ06_NATTX|nr:P-loop NTPase [Natronobacterium texcoconense]SDQ64164.1 ATP-binding protein involved in chromosome partitioning [Natronobacterium texcoconense]
MTRDKLRERLRAVEDPELDDDVVSLGLVTGVTVAGDEAFVSVAFNAPFSPSEWEMCDEIRALCRGMGLVPRIHANPERDGIPGVRNVIAVGGTTADDGTGVVTGALATALATLGARVGVFDFRLETGVETWLDAVDPPDLSSDPIVPVTRRNVSAVRLGPLLPRDGAMPSGDAVVSLLLPQVRDRLEWGGLDYLLVALPSSAPAVRSTVLDRLPTRGTVALGAVETESVPVRTAVRTLSLETEVVGALGTYEDREPDRSHALAYDLTDFDLSCPYLGTVPLESPRTDRRSSRTDDPFRDVAVAITDLIGTINRQRAARSQPA